MVTSSMIIDHVLNTIGHVWDVIEEEIYSMKIIMDQSQGNVSNLVQSMALGIEGVL